MGQQRLTPRRFCCMIVFGIAAYTVVFLYVVRQNTVLTTVKGLHQLGSQYKTNVLDNIRKELNSSDTVIDIDKMPSAMYETLRKKLNDSEQLPSWWKALLPGTLGKPNDTLQQIDWRAKVNNSREGPARGRDYKANFLRFVIFNFQHCQNFRNLLNITFLFNRCCRSSAFVTPVKYKCYWNDLRGTFARSKIVLTEKLTNGTVNDMDVKIVLLWLQNYGLIIRLI